MWEKMNEKGRYCANVPMSLARSFVECTFAGHSGEDCVFASTGVEAL